MRFRLVLLAAACALAACQPDGKATSRGASRGDRRGVPVAVNVVAVQPRDMAETLELSGTLEAKRQVALTPRIAGRLEEVRVELGDRVARGQVVARLDSADLENRLRQAEAALASAQAGVARQRVDAQEAARQLRTDLDLLAKDFIARQEVASDKARLDAARAAVRAAEADAARQRAALAEAREALSQATLIAPMAGLVAQRHADPGAMVSASSPVVTLVAPDLLETVAFVPESALVRIRLGTPATLSVDALPQRVFSGQVDRISPVVVPETREGQVEIAVKSAGGALRPGMFARVTLRLRTLPQVPALPQDALVVRQGTEGVFLAEEDKAHFRPVTTGLRAGGWVQLQAGPALGAKVVTLGNHLLQDGTPIVDAAGTATGSAAGGRRRHGSRAPRD